MAENNSLSNGVAGNNPRAGASKAQSDHPGVLEVAQGLGHEVKHLAVEVAEQAKRSAEERLDHGKTRAVEGLGTAADALRVTGKMLERRDADPMTDYVSHAADQLDRASSYLRSNSFGNIVEDVEGFARREPAMFLGGAFLVGLVGSRFLKSTTKRGSSVRGLLPEQTDDSTPSQTSGREHGNSRADHKDEPSRSRDSKGTSHRDEQPRSEANRSQNTDGQQSAPRSNDGAQRRSPNSASASDAVATSPDAATQRGGTGATERSPGATGSTNATNTSAQAQEASPKKHSDGKGTGSTPAKE